MVSYEPFSNMKNKRRKENLRELVISGHKNFSSPVSMFEFMRTDILGLNTIDTNNKIPLIRGPEKIRDNDFDFSDSWTVFYLNALDEESELNLKDFLLVLRKLGIEDKKHTNYNDEFFQGQISYDLQPLGGSNFFNKSFLRTSFNLFPNSRAYSLNLFHDTKGFPTERGGYIAKKSVEMSKAESLIEKRGWNPCSANVFEY